MIVKEEIRKICARMDADLHGYRVVLFGSRVSGGASDRSDFDIGIFGESPLPLKIFYEMEELFDEIPTLYRIDWVDLNRVSPGFRHEAIKHAEVLYRNSSRGPENPGLKALFSANRSVNFFAACAAAFSMCQCTSATALSITAAGSASN